MGAATWFGGSPELRAAQIRHDGAVRMWRRAVLLTIVAAQVVFVAWSERDAIRLIGRTGYAELVRL